MNINTFFNKFCEDKMQKRLIWSFLLYSTFVLLSILGLLIKFSECLLSNFKNCRPWDEGSIFLFFAVFLVPFLVLSLVNSILSFKQKYSTYMIVTSIILCFGYFPIGAIILIPSLNMLTQTVWENSALDKVEDDACLNKRLNYLSLWYIAIAFIVALGLLILLTYTGIDIFYYGDYGSSKEGAYIGFFETIGVGVAFLIALVNTSIYLKRKKRWQFIISFASILCFFIPFGTIIGIMTLKTLKKRECKEFFNSCGPN